MKVSDEPLGDRSKEPLTGADMTVVETTWKAVGALGAEKVGALLFKNIFTIAPDALSLYSFKNEPHVRSYDTPGIRSHGAKVVKVVGTAVDSIRDLAAVAPSLRELAVRHVGYGVRPAHYDVVGRALLQTLEAGLGAAFDRPARSAWAKVWHAVSSTMLEAASEAREDGTPFTAVDVKLVRDTWASVEALGAQFVGVKLFRNIFEMSPGAVQLFPFKNEQDLYNSEKLKLHGVKVVTVVGLAVGSLEKLDDVIPTVQDLGRRHAGYGAKAAHYDVVGKALLKTFRDTLGSGFSREAEVVWAKMYRILSSAMVEASKDILPSSELSDVDVGLVRDSWGCLKSLRPETVGVALFRNIFELAPNALDLYPFKNERDLYNSEKLKSHGVRVVTVVGAAVDKIEELDMLALTLTELGMKHVGYGAKPAHYDIVGKALLKTLRDALGTNFTNEVESAWMKLYGFITKIMVEAT